MTSASPSSETVTPPSLETNSHTPASDWLANCLLHGERPQPHQVGIIIGQEALQQINQHCRSDLYRELGGVLLGKAFQRQGQQWVAVAAALPAISTQHGPIHFTFTADVWAQINRDRESRYPQLAIVGWFHTHPDLGVFYSADDVVVHTVAFREMWHIGLVVDPVRHEACFFGWDQQPLTDGLERAILPHEGFYERTDNQPTSVIDWRVGRDRYWDQPRSYRESGATLSGVNMASDVSPDENTIYAPRNDWPVLSSGLGIWLGLLNLFVMFCLLLGVFIPLERRNAALESVVMALADDTMTQANALGLAECPDARLRILAPQAGETVLTGDEITIIGTAEYAAANRYTLYLRPSGGEAWTTVRSFRRDQTFNQLGSLDTATLIPGSYELRLSALTTDGTTLGASCTIAFELK